MRRTLSALATVAVVAGAALTAPASASSSPASSTPASSTPPSSTPITWHDCTTPVDGWECGTLTVPRDWDDTSNPDTAEIAFALHRATTDRIGALSFNPGGPGGAGIPSGPGVLKRLPVEVQQRFDFVSWDPRGVGESTPHLAGCRRTPPPDPSFRPATGPVDWHAIALDDSERSAPALAECFAANPRVAPYLGTYYVIRDLDALRAALGYDQWNFWGMSYGTRVGYRYARQFPDRVRALILDGSVAPNETLIYRGSQGVYKYAQSAATWGAGAGPEAAMKLRRITRALNHRTVTINGRVQTRWSILPNIYSSISYQQRWPSIAKMINDVYAALFEGGVAGPDTARALRRLRTQVDPAQVDPVSQGYLLEMVNCADVRDRPSLEEITSASKAAFEANSVAAAMDALSRGASCTGLPEAFAPQLPYLTQPLALPVAPVVVQSYGDSRTAWTGGRQMASYLAGAAFISYEGTQHVAYMRLASRCLNDPVTHYLLTAQTPESRTCSTAALR